MDMSFSKIEQYLILFELISYKHVNEDIIKVKYRELARRFHPDITKRDTNKQMAEINEARDFLINNIPLVNRTLSVLWEKRDQRLQKIYQEAVLANFMSATISMLEKSISLLKSIYDYKDSKTLIKKYEERLKQLIREEELKDRTYREAILNIKIATIVSLKKAIRILESLGNYKDSRRLILSYKNRINEILAEEQRIKKVYEEALRLKDETLTSAEFNKIINDLKNIDYKDSRTLLNHYYARMNLVSSIQIRFENEQKEKAYLKILSNITDKKTINDFEGLITELSKIKGYKDVDQLIDQAKLAIDKIKQEQENRRKETVFIKANELLKNLSDNKKLQEAIDLLKSIKGYKNSEDLISGALKQIFDNEDNERKRKIYESQIKIIKTNDIKTLEGIIKTLKGITGYKDTNYHISELELRLYQQKEKIYNEGINTFIRANNEDILLINKAISILIPISDFMDVKSKISNYKETIKTIEKNNKQKLEQQKEDKYLKGLIKDHEKTSVSLLQNKVEILKETNGYKDSNKLIEMYEKHIKQLKIEKEELLSELSIKINNNLSVKDAHKLTSKVKNRNQRKELSKIILEDTRVIEDFNNQIDDNIKKLLKGGE